MSRQAYERTARALVRAENLGHTSEVQDHATKLTEILTSRPPERTTLTFALNLDSARLLDLIFSCHGADAYRDMAAPLTLSKAFPFMLLVEDGNLDALRVLESVGMIDRQVRGHAVARAVELDHPDLFDFGVVGTPDLHALCTWIPASRLIDPCKMRLAPRIAADLKSVSLNGILFNLTGLPQISPKTLTALLLAHLGDPLVVDPDTFTVPATRAIALRAGSAHGRIKLVKDAGSLEAALARPSTAYLPEQAEGGPYIS